MIYLGYPIDHATQEQREEIEDEVIGVRLMLRQRWPNAHVYDPGSAFPLSAGRPTNSILAINGKAMDQCDRGLFFWPQEVDSTGVPLEIQAMAGAGKPVAVVTDRDMTDRKWDQVMVYMPDRVEMAIGRLIDALPTRGTQPVDLLPGGYERVPLQINPILDGRGWRLPTRTHPDDAGLDLFVSQDVTVEPGRFADVPCSIKVGLPDGVWGLITGRSSTIRSRGLMVTQGVIDTGYRGPIFTGVFNLTDLPVHVLAGERLAQLILMPNLTQGYQPQLVPGLADSNRGSDGFGSSGL